MPSEPDSPPQELHILRDEPYRLFFMQGILLAFAGVSHWLLHAFGVLEDYRSIFHAMTQIQGFLMSFAVGFLLTMIPRRTESAPPAWWQIGVGIVCPVGTTIAAWFGLWALSQVFWWGLAGMMIGFVATRVRRGGRRPPDSFVWLPLGFAIGIAGSVLTAAGGVLGTDYWWLHTLGRGLVLQGMFAALIIGVGGLAIPLMTRGVKPEDSAPTTRSRSIRALHLAAALVFVGSFIIELQVSLRAGMAMRALVCACVLVVAGDLWRPPNKPGWNRWLIWIAAWMVPIGFALAAIFHMHHKAGLHVVFIGGFATLTLAVSTQVTLGHGGFSDLMGGRPVQVALLATLLAGALALRVAMEVDKAHFFEWMGISAALFLGALLVWCGFLLPKLWPKRASDQSSSIALSSR